MECFKVNIIFAEKFIAMKQGVKIKEYAFFNTETIKILEVTDIGEWFETKVKEEISVKIKDFQLKKIVFGN